MTESRDWPGEIWVGHYRIGGAEGRWVVQGRSLLSAAGCFSARPEVTVTAYVPKEQAEARLREVEAERDAAIKEADRLKAAEREKTEAAELEASNLRVELQLAEWDRQYLRQKLSEQPDTEGGDAHATRRNESGIPVAEGAAVDDGRALDQCPTCGSGDRFRLKPPCSIDSHEPDPWHRNRAASQRSLDRARRKEQQTEEAVHDEIICALRYIASEAEQGGDWARYELVFYPLQAEREKTEAARRQRDAAERELAAAHKKSAAPGGPDMANISGRSEAKDKPPITAHTEQPDTEGGDADAHCPRGHEAIPVAEGAAVDDGRALSEHYVPKERAAPALPRNPSTCERRPTMPTDREQQEVERLRWVFWECDCGALNREARPGFQHPCPACGHPATIDPVEVMPVSEHEAALQAEREKTEAAEREANELRAKLAAVDAEAYERWEIGVQPDTEGGDAHATRTGIPVAEGAAVDDGRALSEHYVPKGQAEAQLREVEAERDAAIEEGDRLKAAHRQAEQQLRSLLTDLQGEAERIIDSGAWETPAAAAGRLEELIRKYAALASTEQKGAGR